MAEYIDLDTPLELYVMRGQTYKPYTSTLRDLLDVNSIPYTAADVRPVVRGKWLTEYEPDGKPYCLHCSVCDDDFSIIGITTASNFCPNCGADMRPEPPEEE